MKRLILALLTGAALAAPPTNAFAQSAREVRGASPLNAIENEPAPKLIVDPPLPDQLAGRRTCISYRCSARVHSTYLQGSGMHVTVDDLPWHWTDASDINTRSPWSDCRPVNTKC